MNPVTKSIVTWLGIALLIAAVLLYANHYKVLAVENQGKASQLREKLESTERDLAGQSKVLAAYREQSQKNAELAAEQQLLVTSLSSEASAPSARASTGAENEQIKRWADTLLPDGIARMRVRPTITGAKAYYQWLSDGNSVRASGGEPIVKPRSELANTDDIELAWADVRCQGRCDHRVPIRA